MARVSVVVPTFNAERYLSDTLASVVGQTLPDWELIVVDDGSTDGSAAVAREWSARDGRIKLVQQVNRGVAAARNVGLAASDAGSEYLLFLDSDDCLEPSMLDVMASCLDGDPGVGMAHCMYMFVDEQGCRMGGDDEPWTPRWAPSRRWIRRLSDDDAETPFVSIFCLAAIIPSLSLIRRATFALTPGWDETFGQPYEDTNLFLNLALAGRVRYVPAQLVRHRRHPAQSTSDPALLAAQERKLYERWRSPQGITERQQETVRDAWRFRERRLIPAQALVAARRHLRHGRPDLAIRFLGGAIRISLKSFLRRETRWSGATPMP